MVSPDAPIASVADLVESRLSTENRWNLALVQRAEVWDELRMRHLLDSLLAGYPIGAILLGRTAAPSRELVVQADGSRVDTDAAPDAWQILDGQQRINALFSIFTDKGNYGRFLLDVSTERPQPAPAQSRGAKKKAVPHIRHLAAGESIDDRDRLVELSGWAAWVAMRDIETIVLTEDTVVDHLRSVDPNFRADLDPEQRRIATENLRRLIQAWTKPSIPILRAELSTPLDVLEVFTRINLGGVNAAGADIFFAGVKTFWRDAEERMDSVLTDVPMLGNRLGALRFLSRLSSRAVGDADVLPLTVDRLAGHRGDILRQTLAEITAPESTARRRLKAFTDWYRHASNLGYALRIVTPELWDDVLAWAVASDRTDAEWYALNRDTVDAYLLGATIFRYRTILGDQFRRLAFHEALEAGSAGRVFPLEEIVGVLRGKTRLLGTRGRSVRGLETQTERRHVADLNGRLLTALAQGIPYTLSEGDDFEWDHIFPQAQAHRMWVAGEAGRRRHHPDRHLINSPGNFWALNSSANSSLQDVAGHEKFRRLRTWLADDAAWNIWEESRWSINDDEIESFIQIDELLNDDPASIDQGMALFTATVTARTERLLDDMLGRFPLVKKMAYDDTAPIEEPLPKRIDYRDALGLSSGEDNLRSLDRRDALRRLRQRVRALEPMIADGLKKSTEIERQWLWLPRRRGDTQVAYAAFELTSGNCVELMFSWDALRGVRLEMKAYSKDGSATRPYDDFAHVSIGRSWTYPDEEIVAAFLDAVRDVEDRHSG